MRGMKELNEWLAHCERLHPKTIALGLERVQSVMQRMGLYPPPPGAPDIPGLEIAGEVVGMGPGVKRWKNGDMCLRWTAAGMLEAEQQFRKIIGFNDLAKLAIAVEQDVAAKRAAAFTSQPLNASPSTAPEVTATTV